VDLESFLDQKFIGEKSVWENLLRTELKLEDISAKTKKKSFELGEWPVLSLEAKKESILPLSSEWKKTSQSYVEINLEEIKSDLENGVKIFFFYKSHLNNELWKKITELFLKEKNPFEIEVVLLGSGSVKFESSNFTIIDESQGLSGRKIHEAGGSETLELAFILTQLIKRLKENNPPLYLFTFLGSSFFKNISKVRALKYLIRRAYEIAGLPCEYKIVTLTSFRDWGFYERYSNILRNIVTVSSGLMADADIIQSTGHQFLFELAGIHDESQTQRSLRLSRNTFHILSLESMLSVVQDSVSGSFHLENLAQEYARLSWEKMQKFSLLEERELNTQLNTESEASFQQRVETLHTRKFIISGINDYSNIEDEIGDVDFSKISFQRTTQHFESLRFSFSKLSKKPKICLAVLGDSAKLSTRANFCKNYFETMGLIVFETHDRTEIQNHPEIVVLCSSDEDYPNLHLNLKAKSKFLAGKIQLEGFKNIFVGQNVFEVLKDLYEEWSAL